MKLLFVHAHFDDFEVTAAGTFELWHRRDPKVQRRVLICTDGAAGHHAMTREQTARRRLAEQETAAKLGGFEFRLLKDSQGRAFREARLHASTEFLPALWNAIRDFEPDYLFCPPVPVDPLAGVHVDHLDVAQAIRSVAYMINVPHAFTPEYPTDETTSRPVRTPVILNTFDGYLVQGHGMDLAIDVSEVVAHVARLAWCHESQFREWLPWIDRHNLTVAPNLGAWERQFAGVLERRKSALGIRVPGLFELFQVTAWGTVPSFERLMRDFPGISADASRLNLLRDRLTAWHAAAGE